MSSPVSRAVTVHLARVNLTGDALFFQDVAHRLPDDPLDPQFSQLANDARVFEARRRLSGPEASQKRPNLSTG